MPETAKLLVFAAAALALVAVPGPNILYITTRSMSGGRRAGLACSLGVETGTFLHVTAAALGLSALLGSSALAFNLVKYGGAAYLVFLGVRALARREEASSPLPAAPVVPLRRAYAEGVLVQVLNPKVALFFLAFLPQFVDPDRGAVALQILVLGALLSALGFVVNCLCAFAAGTVGARLRHRPALRYITAAVYLALGATAALTGEPRRA